MNENEASGDCTPQTGDLKKTVEPVIATDHFFTNALCSHIPSARNRNVRRRSFPFLVCARRIDTDRQSPSQADVNGGQ
jgi:hypothetical protein